MILQPRLSFLGDSVHLRSTGSFLLFDYAGCHEFIEMIVDRGFSRAVFKMIIEVEDYCRCIHPIRADTFQKLEYRLTRHGVPPRTILQRHIYNNRRDVFYSPGIAWKLCPYFGHSCQSTKWFGHSVHSNDWPGRCPGVKSSTPGRASERFDPVCRVPTMRDNASRRNETRRTDAMATITRADRAYHDVAQFHLHEFGGESA